MAKRRPSGDGMVRKRDDGRWEGRIVVGHKENGDSIFHYVSAKTQKALMEKMHRCIVEYDGAELTEDSRMTLGEWLDIWLKECAEPSVRPSTYKGYRGYAERNIKPSLGNKQISKVTAADVQTLYRKLQREGGVDGGALSPTTVRRIHGVLHQALNAAVDRHLIVKNPTDDVTLPKKVTAAKTILNDKQLERFMEAIKADEHWHDFFYLEITTGLRRGELCGLMWTDFDAEKGTLTVRRTLHNKEGGGYYVGETKTGAGRRIIKLPPSTVQLLSERKRTSISQWIFPNPIHPEDPIMPNSGYTRMKKLLAEAGLPDMRFHDLRHPYVKHTTKIFSLRLMDFQAQACPDARRKTRGACQLLRVGQSRSPVRPLCNRKRFSCLPPQSKMSWILYAISMRLSGYTSTRSISSSASSVVSVSASKIALDAFLRLSCRACSSCFCFACANTAA